MIRSPVLRTHSWSAHSSPWSRRSSCSYSLRLSLGRSLRRSRGVAPMGDGHCDTPERNAASSNPGFTIRGVLGPDVSLPGLALVGLRVEPGELLRVEELSDLRVGQDLLLAHDLEHAALRAVRLLGELRGL